MSARLSLKPHDAEPDLIGLAVPEGYLVTNEQLAMLGDGDIKRGRKVLRNMIVDERPQDIDSGPTAKPKNVRFATPNDENALLRLLIVDVEENAVRVAPVDPKSIADCILIGTRGKGGIIGVIDGPDGVPVATTGLISERWWWSRSWHLTKVWDFVHPDHRKTNYARDLIEFGKWVGDDFTRRFGYRVYVLSGVLATKRTKEKVRLYKRSATQVGAFFLHPGPPPEGVVS